MDKPPLTSAEIGMLWTQYMQNSMSVQILKYFQETVEDKDIQKVIEGALTIAEKAVNEIGHIYQQEEMVIPFGFSEADVDLKAPRIFTDPFMLAFVENLSTAGMLAWSISQGTSTRSDIRNLFTGFLTENSSLLNVAIDTALSKGLYIRPPYVSKPNKIEFIEGKKYLLSGLSPFKKRPLNNIEITHLFQNIKTNSVGEMISTAFAQTTNSQEVMAYMKRGKEISHKHKKIFAEFLSASDLSTPMTWDNGITDSTTRVFSDKLMMFLIDVLSASGQGNYATASTASMRYDLVINYQRLSVEIAFFAKDGLEIMIDNKWIEEPPQAPDRDELFHK
ncbi:DUF3231 family protein [Salinibacillus xinjiangensis]|uniref:DUF3231 family protein n=1 Tax=Salinibacillus xinjiangensis TaxID=1229268 RepID=A0A6G1X9E9_9BACI|nr:DUF3231 family protein [Salinibacillus xinjiangensis]MRG87567.1 DUF3231 family protein [Salinibacillus xinjiangensis]